MHSAAHWCVSRFYRTHIVDYYITLVILIPLSFPLLYRLVFCCHCIWHKSSFLCVYRFVSPKKKTFFFCSLQRMAAKCTFIYLFCSSLVDEQTSSKGIWLKRTSKIDLIWDALMHVESCWFFFLHLTRFFPITAQKYTQNTTMSRLYAVLSFFFSPLCPSAFIHKWDSRWYFSCVNNEGDFWWNFSMKFSTSCGIFNFLLKKFRGI